MSGYLNSREAADMIGCHHSTITRLVRDGDLVPAMKGPGATGALFFTLADVEAIAADRGAS